MSFECMRRDEFERVAMPHTQSLLQAAQRLSRARAVAEDMVQETLLHAWNAFDRFERGTNCKAWLFRILINVSRQYHRKNQARPVTLPLDSGGSQKVVQLYVAPPQFATAEVLSALNMLSIDHRLVLMLAVVEGFTCKEIAAMCALPVGTVMSRLSRARAELRHILTEAEGSKRLAANAG
ncbi:MAG TPA: sigma-70 family RNA polymerase sigma factor [Pyrinomonadaceae bacterium]|jgi:RNA polymerase sigma-70 factor (ECF subfamily)